MSSVTPRLLCLAAVVAMGMVAEARQATAATMSFQEGVSGYTHDATYIRSGSPSDNFDGDGDLELIAGPTTGDVLRTLLEFDVSAIPTSDQIDSASLILTTHSNVGIGGTETFNVHEYDFDIMESDSTWDDPDGDGDLGAPDSTDGGTLGTLLTSASFAVTSTEIDVTFGDTAAFRTAVSDALADDGFLRLIVVNIDETVDASHNFARFAADSFGTVGNRPELIVTHSAVVPEPSTATLALLSLLGLGALRLRRRRRRA